ncbi:MFS transporter [Methylobacillus glycogenes]|uniref:MFS transporter n=1 Tax=Methylobacillus glycogenes TaxID=406 RepID=UPI000A65BF38|nr:MFS transporter [Methylobacillus glycogenes]
MLAKVQAGVFLGLLLARVVAGGVSDIAGWRMVYLSSAACMLLLACLLWRSLARGNGSPAVTISPAVNISQVTGSYPRFIGSMLALLWRHRLLQVRGMLALLMFAVFNIFWSALSLALSAPPYAYSNTAIGALGLVGAIGALGATQAGRWLDKGAHRQVTLIALLLLAIAWWPLAFMSWSLAALMLGIILLDMGGQALHVSNQSLLLRSNAEQQHGSMIGMYMLFYALGSALGAAAGTAVFAHDGWQGVCLLGFSLSALALVFWLATRRALN